MPSFPRAGNLQVFLRFCFLLTGSPVGIPVGELLFYNMRKYSFLVVLCVIAVCFTAHSQGLQLHYNFQSLLPNAVIPDVTGNGRTATLSGSANVRSLGEFGVVETGNTSGFVQLNSNVGEIIAGLSDFTIATYVYIDPAQNVGNHGNFIWSFANSQNIASDANGCMFFSARESRFVISPRHWQNEQQVSLATQFGKGEWFHLTYVQSGNNGRIYLNGVSQRNSTINMLPSALGATAHNFLFKSPYASDALLLNSKITDFRIYNTALSAANVQQLAVHKHRLDTLLFNEQAVAAAQALDLGDISAIRSNLTLPVTGNHGSTVTWASSHPAVISSSGVVSRPAFGSQAVQVVLTATVTRNFVSSQRQFTATVLPQFSDQESVDADVAELQLTANLHLLRSNLNLPASGREGSVITWTSSNPSYLNHQGEIINRPEQGAGNMNIIMRALVTKNQASTERDFQITLAEDEGYVGYLFSYFTGNHITQEAIRFAYSFDGFNYKTLNNNQPVILSADISLTGGVRDPHILRGEDGYFYMVVTDMVSANGWSSNRGMVLLRSSDLVNWTSATVHIPTRFPAEFGNVDRVWAPQTIYDPVAQKYMVYFSMRKGSGDYDKIYYAYANADFTDLESVPTQLFYHPDGVACIDGDIVFHEGQYHMFFKTEGAGNGIKKAVSDVVTGGWVMLDRFLQQTTHAVEGSCTFRLFNTDTWIMMYDVYGAGFYQFTESTDLENFSVITSGISMDFSPRHGTVLPITAQEMHAIRQKWDATMADNDAIEYSSPVIATDSASKSIVFRHDEQGQLNIFDISGRKMHHLSYNSQQNYQINLPATGLYLLQMIDKHGSVSSLKVLI